MQMAMDKFEISLLIFFETCCVDLGGLVDTARMNDRDRVIARKWTEMGLVNFQRLASECIRGSWTYCVTLSPEAWSLATKYRKNRADRLYEKRNA